MNTNHNDTERRKHTRKEYGPSERPMLKIGGFEFEVLNVSEKGLSFTLDKQINLAGWVNGKLVLESQTTFDIEGIIVRRQKGEIGLHLVTPLNLT